MSNFFVHVVESPSPEDLLDGRTEGRSLCSYLETAQIPYFYNLAVDKTRFDEAMTSRFWDAQQKFKLPPVLHLSCHGCEDGIQLTHQREVGGIIPWSELATYIRTIHRTFPNRSGLGVCMSTCGGAHGSRMAEVINPDDVPFTWLVGTNSTLELRDLALAFAVFYRMLDRFDPVQHIQNAIKLASGVDDFRIESGDLTQQRYSQAMLEAYRKLLQHRQPLGGRYQPRPPAMPQPSQPR